MRWPKKWLLKRCAGNDIIFPACGSPSFTDNFGIVAEPVPSKPWYESATLWLVAAIAAVPAVVELAKVVYPEAVPVLEQVAPILEAVLAFVVALRRILIPPVALTK